MSLSAVAYCLSVGLPCDGVEPSIMRRASELIEWFPDGKFHPSDCPHCRQPLITDRAGDCIHCLFNTSTRVEAVARGLRYYYPVAPCPDCGQRSARAVSNAKCRGCRERRGDRRHTTGKALADAIVSRAQARSVGLGMYRTGMPCKHGHTAPRFVANGACVECDRLRRTRG